MSVESYRDLVAWQKSMDLVEIVYRQSQTWPRDELYGLTNQARRAAVSVPANIAEGHGRRDTGDRRQATVCAEVGRIIGGLIRSMR